MSTRKFHSLRLVWVVAVAGVLAAAVPTVFAIELHPQPVPLSGAILTSSSNFGLTGSVSNLAPGTAQPDNLGITVTNPYTVPIDLLSVTVTVTAVDQTGSSTPETSCPGTELYLDNTQFSGSPPQAIVTFAPAAHPVNPGSPVVVPMTLLLGQTAGNSCQNVTFQFGYAGVATYGLTSSGCITSTQKSYTVKSGQAVCIGGRVTGTLTVQSGGALYLNGATINGSLVSTGAVAVEVCGSTINGGLSISGNTGFLMVGDGGDDPDEGMACAENSIGGGVSLTGNGAAFEIAGNAISGNAIVTNNSGSGPTTEDASSEIEGNTITGTLSCTGNAAIFDGTVANKASSKTGQCAVGF